MSSKKEVKKQSNRSERLKYKIDYYTHTDRFNMQVAR